MINFTILIAAFGNMIGNSIKDRLYHKVYLIYQVYFTSIRAGLGRNSTLLGVVCRPQANSFESSVGFCILVFSSD